MTFCSKEQDERKIITKVEHVNNSYTLHYLDGSESTFINNDKEYLKKLEDIMIEQAKERNKNDYVNTYINKWGSFIVFLASVSLTSECFKKNMLNLACMGFVLSMCLFSEYRKNSKRIKEYKKYKILLENYKEFKENPNISKIIEVDAFYRDPVDIFNIDRYSLYDMRLMKKELKK